MSDPLCVRRHQQEFLELLKSEVDVLFANEQEACLLFGSSSFEAALSAAQETGLLAAITRGPAGSVVLSAGDPVAVPAEPVASVIDTTGAGDLYAAGFLYGLTHGAGPERCAVLGGLCASEVISHMGARPEKDLRVLVSRALTRPELEGRPARIPGSDVVSSPTRTRGRVAEAPSSTLFAIRRALELGVTGIELDMHAMADRQLVVCHDATVDRTTEGHGALHTLTLEQVRSLDNSYWFVPGGDEDHGLSPSAYSLRGRRPRKTVISVSRRSRRFSSSWTAVPRSP